MKRKDIRIRDPFIVNEGGIYYMYSATCSADGRTVEVYRSRDLEEWDEPTVVYRLDSSTWRERELWAPEVHKYRGRFYLLLSILGKGGLRGTEISVSDTPDGIFQPIADAPATPAGQSCIDGTLWVDGDRPYMIYSHDWPDNYDAARDAYIGQICGVELSADLKQEVGEPFFLFDSSDVPYSAAAPSRSKRGDRTLIRYGSDAPFINRLADGRLLLTWSPYPGNNYVVLGAVAKDIRGPWQHFERPIFDGNGGHAMFFRDNGGRLMMCMHQPERHPDERAMILPFLTSDAVFLPDEIKKLLTDD